MRIRSQWWLAALAAMALLVGCGSAHHSVESPADVIFPTLSGTQLNLAEFRGRPLLVNFWSTSCAVCLSEMPELNALYHELTEAGVAMISVTMPYDPPNEVLEITRQQELRYPVALDIDGKINAAFGRIQGTPTAMLLSAEGKIVAEFIGRLDRRALAHELGNLRIRNS